MSPRVTLTISAEQIAELRRTPRVHLLEAVAAVRGRGIWLRCGEPGVVAGMADWRPDRHLQPRGVSLAGAVLLYLQPEPRDGEEPLDAAARALDVPRAWVEGAEAGWCHELMSCEWLARPDADLYLDGYEMGGQVQAVFEAAR